MACLSTSLEDVVKKADGAREQIEKLQQGLEKTDVLNRQRFKEKREEFFKNVGLNDVEPADVNFNIKVEFASEFSLDKIIPAVKAAIDTAVGLYGGVNPISDKTQKAFSDLVVAIGECAKFSSEAASSLSFATNRLSPGIFVSLYATSNSIKDANMFNKKAVTATMYYYQLSKSVKDIEIDMVREATVMYAQKVIDMNKRILELADQLALGQITYEIFVERTETIRKAIGLMRPTLASLKNESPKYNALVANLAEREIEKAATILKPSNADAMKKINRLIDTDKLIKEYNDELMRL